MRILYVDLEREWRGGQSQALLTVKGLRDLGKQVELLAAQGSPIAERVANSGIVVHTVPRLGLRLWAARTLRKLLASRDYTILHLNESHALTAAWLANAHAGAPLLLSRRIGFPLQKNALSRARFRAVSSFVANSKNVAQSLVDSGISPERILVVNEGVEIAPLATSEERASARKRWGIRSAEFLIGCASVFVPEKGQRHLIEAMPKVRAAHPEVRLLLAGDGRCLAEMKALAKGLGQGDAVLFPGFVKHVSQVYAALDAFAFPSEFEGLGTALQAAMAAGLPCISTARGALGEVVTSERTALVAEPDAGAFSEAILRLVNDSDLRRRLGEEGRREVELRFSAQRMVENTLRAYGAVLAKRAAPSL